MSSNAMSVSVSEAARLAGVARSSLYKHWIQKGKLTVTKDARGKVCIDMSELLRVFPDLGSGNSKNKRTEDAGLPAMASAVVAAETAQLQAEVMALREQVKLQMQLIEAKDQNLLDLRQSLKLLEFRQEAAPPAEEGKGKKRKLLK
jgi:hypothetical protein